MAIKVKVPASSANLGPGFDVLAVALDLWLTLAVSEADEFSVDPGAADLPADRSNLCVSSFERLHPAAGLRFEVSGDIPLARGLGSSAAAIVAGLTAANEVGGLGLGQDQIYAHAVAIEGHPDNVAAAVYGGFVVCPTTDGDMTRPPVRLAPPADLAALLVIPDRPVATAEARAALPQSVTIEDAVANLASISQLVIGIERSDTSLIAAGLDDRLHQPYRADLYPESSKLLGQATSIGAVGATVSGAGPSVLVWCELAACDTVADALAPLIEGWASLGRLSFADTGAEVMDSQ